MKRITAIALLTIASFVTAGSALAADRGVEAKVPFDFTVGSHLLPAGTYTIASHSSNVIELRNAEGRIVATTVALSAHDDAKGNGDLVFDRYGNKYFLSEVLCPAASMSAKIPASKMEKLAKTQEARLPSDGQILVAAK
jgi:hypothetical protein